MANGLQRSPVFFGSVLEKPDDPRFANVVQNPNGNEACDISFIGVPSDLGTEAGGGRAGSAEAPNAIRRQLLRYGTATNIERCADMRTLRIFDLGNIIPENDIAKNHKRCEDAVRDALSRSRACIIFGGSHDLSLATVSALSRKHGANIGGMNVDAHFDVRPVIGGVITSGTPFWRLIASERLCGRNFWEVGAQGHVNAKAHMDFLVAHGSQVVFLSEARSVGIATIVQKFFEATLSCEALFVSIDIDVMAQAFAPGSSAPSPDGLFPEDVLSLAYLFGKHSKVRLFEIMEVNPRYDTDERTARLAANIVLEFCAGFANRR